MTNLVDESDWAPPTRGRPPGAVETLLRESFARTQETYTYPTRLPFEACWLAAWKHHGRAMKRLAKAVDARPDLRSVEGFVYHLPCDSGCEALFDQFLIAAGWKPILMSPQDLGCADPRLLDPATGVYVGHRPFRGFGVVGAETSVAALAQVPIHAVQRYAMDFLVAVRYRTLAALGTIEVDGEGHVDKNDAERRGHIGLPEIRFSYKQLEEPGFWGHCVGRLRELCLKHGRPTLQALGATDLDRVTVRDIRKKQKADPAAPESGVDEGRKSA